VRNRSIRSTRRSRCESKRPLLGKCAEAQTARLVQELIA
jgi:hypothetical protein